LQVLAGSDPAHLQVVGTAPWDGLETGIPVSTPASGVVAVRALGASGDVLGTSRAVAAG